MENSNSPRMIVIHSEHNKEWKYYVEAQGSLFSVSPTYYSTLIVMIFLIFLPKHRPKVL